jgi:hypothetical protein
MYVETKAHTCVSATPTLPLNQVPIVPSTDISLPEQPPTTELDTLDWVVQGEATEQSIHSVDEFDPRFLEESTLFDDSDAFQDDFLPRVVTFRPPLTPFIHKPQEPYPIVLQVQQEAQLGYECPMDGCGYRVTCRTVLVHFDGDKMVHRNGSPVSTLNVCKLVAHMETQHGFNRFTTKTCKVCDEKLPEKDRYLHFIHSHCEVQHYTDGVHHGSKNDIVSKRRRCKAASASEAKACRCLQPGPQGNDEPGILRRDVSARKRRRHPSRNGLVAAQSKRSKIRNSCKNHTLDKDTSDEDSNNRSLSC